MHSKPTVRLHRGHYSNYVTDDGYVVFPVHERLHRGGQSKRRSGWLVQFELTLTVQDDCPTLADARAAIAAHRALTFCRLCGTRVTTENRGAHTNTTVECSDCTQKVLAASTLRGWLYV